MTTKKQAYDAIDNYAKSWKSKVKPDHKLVELIKGLPKPLKFLNENITADELDLEDIMDTGKHVNSKDAVGLRRSIGAQQSIEVALRKDGCIA